MNRVYFKDVYLYLDNRKDIFFDVVSYFSIFVKNLIFNCIVKMFYKYVYG